MELLRRGAVLLTLLAASSLFVWTATSNSAGAPANSAEQGCTCHNAQPSNAVTVAIQGLPESYQAGMAYNITITITGGPPSVPVASQNQGGFALKVSAGSLAAPDGITVTGGTFATHSAATNNQRTWSLQWIAPNTTVGPVNMSVAGNAVNGDTVNAGGLDQWNRATFSVPAAASSPGGGNQTTPPTSPADGTPSVPFVLASLAVIGVVAWRRRQG
jgi:hypothetical protein